MHVERLGYRRAVQKSHVKDYYFFRAKRENFSARSVYKLKNIQEKYQLIRPGHQVLDLGAAPGGWTEYLVNIIGKGGKLWAVDERPLSHSSLQRIKNIGLGFQFLEQPIFKDLDLGSAKMDVIVSDVAPWTAGSKWIDSSKSYELVKRAYELAVVHLKEEGHFIVKIFHSPETIALSKKWQKRFKLGKLYKPTATHKESKEIYFVGQHYNA